jgi:uncharacterized protein YjbI with pentapeptide repeats
LKNDPPDELRKARLERAQRWITNTSSSEPAELPPAAEKAADLDALKKTVEDAASVSSGLWLSYLFALFYIAVAAGAVTHADLFLQRPVKLPFLGIELPLTAFFAIAPILFLITHSYTLVHFVLLAAKAKRFHAELKAQIKDERAPNAAVLREGLRGQLPSNIFVQFLAGPRELREGLFGRFLAVIASTTLVIGPLALLLLLQLQFLPYHDASIIWVHRVALVVDLALVWWLWRKILAGQAEIDKARWRPSWIGALSMAATAAVVVFSWTVATFPGEWEQQPLAWITSIAPPALNKWRSAANEWLFNGPVDEISRRRESWFSNTLVLPGFSLYEALNIDDPKKVEWHNLFDARGRDLKGAVFDGALLPHTDFTGARLEGASLIGAQLQGASFERAYLQGALLLNAQLQDAKLGNAQLQGAMLGNAQLQRAQLSGAQLQRALLLTVQLQGATLDGAQLQGASLNGAQAQGASLNDARLQGASLNDARLQGVSLNGAQLQGTSLMRAKLQGASLIGTQLQGASLWSAQLQGAVLLTAELQGARLESAQVQGASFVLAQLLGAELDYTNLTAVNFVRASVWRAEFPSEAARNMSALELNWRPKISTFRKNFPWTSASYEALKQQVEEVVPQGEQRKQALKNIQRLDCKKAELASCDPNAPEPTSVAVARRMIERASVDDATYTKALAGVLGELVCGGDGDAIHILRGLLRNERIKETGAAAPALVRRIMSEDCPVSAALTDDDKAKLRAVAIEIAPPPKVPLASPPATRNK